MTTEPQKNKTAIKISRLCNSMAYFFDLVFLLDEEKSPGVRLIIRHQGVICYDTHYSSVRGGRIAFTNFCARRAYDETVKPEWSEFYSPEKTWLDKILTGSVEIKK